MNNWITIKEKLPIVGKDVLVCDRDGDVYLTHRTQYDNFFTEAGDEIRGVIAWQYLPKPYKETKV